MQIIGQLEVLQSRLLRGRNHTMAHGIAQNITDYVGRLKHFVNVTSPTSLLYSDKEIRKAQEVLSDKEMQKSFSVEEMTQFKRVTDATIHPATNEIIPTLLRVSAIAPVNVPLVFCMLQCPPSNLPGTLFLHWLNQSYNTACNYANRSGKEQSIESTATAYVLAVGSACTFAYGLGKAYKLAPPSFRHFGVMIPCLATVAANVSNLSFTRMGELTDGAPVFDSEGEVCQLIC
jgi:sideroflexin-5